MNVLVVEPMKEPYEKEIKGDLASLQQEVGGLIEAVYPFREEVAIICNEEGKINGLDYNRALRDEDGNIYDIIAGRFLITGLTEDNFGSLSPELSKQFAEKFRTPERFLDLYGKLIVTPVKQKQHPTKTPKRHDAPER